MVEQRAAFIQCNPGVNMKTRYLIPAGLALLAGVACAVQAAQPVSEADFAAPAARVETPARNSAGAALRQLAAQFRDEAGSLPAGFPLQVRDVAELADARLGYGFQVYDVDANSLAAGSSLSAAARATGTWRFAVLREGRPIGLVTLVQEEGQWQAVSFGGAGLVQEMDAVVQSQAAGAQLRYLRVPQATADFIEVRSAGKAARFAPLRAAREALLLKARDGDGLMAEAELLPELRDSVARNLDR
jgi:hypothetical protein